MSLETALSVYQGLSPTTVKLRNAALCLHEYADTYSAHALKLEQRTAIGDVEGVVAVCAAVKPLLKIVNELKTIPPSAESYVRDELVKAQEFDKQFRAAVKKLGSHIDAQFTQTGKTLEETERVRDVHEELAKQYGELKSFGCYSARAEDYLKQQSMNERLRGSLDDIEALLSKEPSEAVLAQVKQRRQYVASGVLRDGSLRKECKAQGFREGVLRCDVLVKDSDHYLTHSAVAKTELVILNGQHVELQRTNSALKKYELLNKATTEWLPLIGAVYVPYPSAFGRFVQRENGRLAKDNNQRLEQLAAKQYALARKELERITVKRGKTVHGEREHIRASVRRLGELCKVFVALEAPERELCERKKAELSRVYAEKKQVVVKEADVGCVGLPYRTFFASVDDLPLPQAPELRELQRRMREGTTEERLSALVFAVESGIRARGSDRIWMQRFQSQFELDACGGYLARISAPDRLVRLNEGLRKAWA